MSDDAGTLATSAMLMPRVPVSWFGRSGTLTLGGGRLSFADSDGAVVFAHPVGELHSIATRAGGAGFDVWHGDTRHRVHPLQRRFVFGEDQNTLASMGVKAATKKWCEFLVPQVTGTPPPGAKVRRPWSTAAHALVGVASCIGIVAAAIGIPVALL